MARSLFALTALLALASCIATSEAAITAPTIVGWINNITTQSQQLQNPANSITIVNAPLFVIGQGPIPVVVRGLTSIAATGASAASQLATGTLGPFSAADQTAIFNAFRTFVQIHQQLLNILIGKSGLFSVVPIVGAPISGALRSIETAVDTIALALINACEDVASDLTLQANNLKATIQLAISKYEGLSVSVNGNNIQPGGRKLLSVAA